VIGDINSGNLSGIVTSDVNVIEKGGKKFAKFNLLNKFKLSENSPEISGEWQVFCMSSHIVSICESFKQGDTVMMCGFISQKKDEKTGKIFVSFVPNHVLKITGSSQSPNKEPMLDESLPW
jgi:hypothetical protein